MVYFCTQQRAKKAINGNEKLELAEVKNIDLPDDIIDENVNILEGFFNQDAWEHLQAIGTNMMLQLVF